MINISKKFLFLCCLNMLLHASLLATSRQIDQFKDVCKNMYIHSYDNKWNTNKQAMFSALNAIAIFFPTIIKNRHDKLGMLAFTAEFGVGNFIGSLLGHISFRYGFEKLFMKIHNSNVRTFLAGLLFTAALGGKIHYTKKMYEKIPTIPQKKLFKYGIINGIISNIVPSYECFR